MCSAATVGLVAPAVVTMEMWVLAGLGFRGQGGHRAYAPKLDGPQTTGSQKTRAQEAAWPGSFGSDLGVGDHEKETHFSSGRRGPELWLMAPVSCEGRRPRVLRTEESSTLGVDGVRTQDGEWPVAVYGGTSLHHEETGFEKVEWKDSDRPSVNLLYPQPCSQEKLLGARFLSPGVVRGYGKQEMADGHNEQRGCFESWLL